MVSRRNMLKTGLTAVFGACAVQTASASEVQQKSQNNFDVVILGAGTGGLVTAIEAADLGLKPVVLEKWNAALETPCMHLVVLQPGAPLSKKKKAGTKRKSLSEKT